MSKKHNIPDKYKKEYDRARKHIINPEGYLSAIEWVLDFHAKKLHEERQFFHELMRKAIPDAPETMPMDEFTEKYNKEIEQVMDSKDYKHVEEKYVQRGASMLNIFHNTPGLIDVNQEYIRTIEEEIVLACISFSKRIHSMN